MVVLHTGSNIDSSCAGESVYTVTDRSKKRKTADRKAAAAKAAEAAAAVDPSEPWAVHNRQPWADKEVKPAELNEEQKAFLEQVSSWHTLRCNFPHISSAHAFQASTWQSAVQCLHCCEDSSKRLSFVVDHGHI